MVDKSLSSFSPMRFQPHFSSACVLSALAMLPFLQPYALCLVSTAWISLCSTSLSYLILPLLCNSSLSFSDFPLAYVLLNLIFAAFIIAMTFSFSWWSCNWFPSPPPSPLRSYLLWGEAQNCWAYLSICWRSRHKIHNSLNNWGNEWITFITVG